MQEIDDKSIDMVLCDLPYGTTACKWDVIIPFDLLWKQYDRIIKDNGAIALFGSEPFSSYLRLSNIKNYKYDWVWKKEKGLGFLNAKKMPLRDTENISVFYKKPCMYNPQMRPGKPYKCKNKPDKQKGTNNKYNVIETVNTGNRYPITTLEYNRVNRTDHPTQKPVELCEYLIKTYTNEGETILDNCCGSGTTGVAAKNLHRNYILIEKEEKYCQIAEERLRNCGKL
jgi:site-specific DNA-methyltransferase (adenine-specific)